MDPRDLTFETLADSPRDRLGPAWRAAVDHGIDVTLLERNRRLTPDERLAQLDEMLALRLLGQRVQVLSRGQLIEVKRAVARPKGIEVALELEAIAETEDCGL